MADLARYIRIYDPSPTDEAVSKRDSAVKEAITQLRKINDVRALVGLGVAAANAFSTGMTPDPLGLIVASAIKKQASAYVREDRELETTVLSGATLVEFFSTADTASTVTAKDILGATLWSALSYQEPVSDPKLEQLRRDLLTIVSERMLLRGETARKRSSPKDVPVSEADLPQLAKSVEAARGTLSAVITNAAMDREELDVLWWALGGRSPTIAKAYESLSPVVRGLVRGIELGILLRRIPTRSLRSVALSGVPEIDALPLSAVMEQAEGIRDLLAAKVPAQNIIADNQVAFPLLSAIVSGAACEGEPKTGDDWCERAILEAALAALCENPAPRL